VSSGHDDPRIEDHRCGTGHRTLEFADRRVWREPRIDNLAVTDVGKRYGYFVGRRCELQADA
jgi:hypothetical protein